MPEDVATSDPGTTSLSLTGLKLLEEATAEFPGGRNQSELLLEGARWITEELEGPSPWTHSVELPNERVEELVRHCRERVHAESVFRQMKWDDRLHPLTGKTGTRNRRTRAQNIVGETNEGLLGEVRRLQPVILDASAEAKHNRRQRVHKPALGL